LEQAGYSTTRRAWDAAPRLSLAAELERLGREARRGIALLSPACVAALQSEPAFAAGLLQQASGAVTLVRVLPCNLAELAAVPCIDLAGLEEGSACATLLDALRPAEALAPAPPHFPGAAPFPGAALASSPAAVAPTGAAAQLEFAIEAGDITRFRAEVLALKYAHGFHGADQSVALALSEAGVSPKALRVPEGEHRYVDTRGGVAAQHVLYVGMPRLRDLGYAQIGQFPARVLAALAREAPHVQHLALTLHGPGYGLDETEAAMTLCAGCFQALQSGPVPPNLRRISLVEINRGRVQRLRAALEQNLSGAAYAVRAPEGWGYRLSIPREVRQAWEVSGSVGPVSSAGTASDRKPHVFVAMPFRKEWEDLFYYGIQRAVHNAGFLCERIDQEAFTGDIMDQIRRRIESAAIVVAELSGATPNVYLEVGYAWGKGRPTILLVRDPKELHFDVVGQRCLIYDSIRTLEERLTKELRELSARTGL